MHLAVALGMLWSTLVLRNWVPSGPPLFLLFPGSRHQRDGSQKAGPCCPGPGTGWAKKPGLGRSVELCLWIAEVHPIFILAEMGILLHLSWTPKLWDWLRVGGFPMNFLKGINFSFCGLNSEVHIFVCFLSITVCKKLLCLLNRHWDSFVSRGLLKKKKEVSTKYFVSLTEPQEQGRLSKPPFNHLSLKIWRVFYLWGAQPTDMGSHVAVLQFSFCGWMIVTTTTKRNEPPLCWISLCFKSSGRNTWEEKESWLLAPLVQ